MKSDSKIYWFFFGRRGKTRMPFGVMLLILVPFLIVGLYFQNRKYNALSVNGWIGIMTGNCLLTLTERHGKTSLTQSVNSLNNHELLIPNFSGISFSVIGRYSFASLS